MLGAAIVGGYQVRLMAWDPVYRALAAYAAMPVVDATKPPELVADAIWSDVTARIPHVAR